MAETIAEAIAHFDRVVAVYADLIQVGALEYGECVDAIERTIFTAERFSHFTDAQHHALADQVNLRLCQAIDAPQMAGLRAVRIAVRAMIQARKPWPDIYLAAYRAADGRVTSADVERAVDDERLAARARFLSGRNMRNAG